VGAAIDLLQPSSLGTLLDAFIQAVDQEADQFGSIGGSERQHLPEEVVSGDRHGRILASLETDTVESGYSRPQAVSICNSSRFVQIEQTDSRGGRLIR
jgi:hypothetical protein